jgi:hypothetical protein
VEGLDDSFFVSCLTLFVGSRLSPSSQENVAAKTKRELLQQKLAREEKAEKKTHQDIYREMAMRHSVDEEKYQRAIAAYNGRREVDNNDEESDVSRSVSSPFFHYTFLLT